MQIHTHIPDHTSLCRAEAPLPPLVRQSVSHTHTHTYSRRRQHKRRKGAKQGAQDSQYATTDTRHQGTITIQTEASLTTTPSHHAVLDLRRKPGRAAVDAVRHAPKNEMRHTSTTASQPATQEKTAHMQSIHHTATHSLTDPLHPTGRKIPVGGHTHVHTHAARATWLAGDDTL